MSDCEQWAAPPLPVCTEEQKLNDFNAGSDKNWRNKQFAEVCHKRCDEQEEDHSAPVSGLVGFRPFEFVLLVSSVVLLFFSPLARLVWLIYVGLFVVCVPALLPAHCPSTPVLYQSSLSSQSVLVCSPVPHPPVSSVFKSWFSVQSLLDPLSSLLCSAYFWFYLHVPGIKTFSCSLLSLRVFYMWIHLLLSDSK